MAVAALTLAAATAGCNGHSNPASPTLPTDSTRLETPRTFPASLGAVEFDGNDRVDRTMALSASDGSTLKATAPTPLSPINDAQADSLAPVLTVGNSRGRFASAQFRYRFQIYAVRVDGSIVLIDANSVDQGSGITSYRVNLQLEKGTAYQWRARAELDGERGPWSVSATFRTPTLIAIDPPTPISPIDGMTAPSVRPELPVQNGAVSGNAGAVAYEYHLDDEGPTFPNPVLLMASPSVTGTTSTRFMDALAPSTQFWWRVRATNGTLTTNWSVTVTFSTPPDTQDSTATE